MEARTEAHLATAERNHQFARVLLDPTARALLQPPPLEWAVTVAFYAAVHYINGYLWEAQRYEPRSHDDRETAVARTAALRACASNYVRLRRLAFLARYVPLYRPRRGEIEAAVQEHLEQVAATVRHALGLHS
jgi:hypothetical protein